ncbi:hypothetical protein VNO78_28857 [Psophocarpus tetragonolobus]|uniref:Uncharacterized protein n=1 Tax=Psophocarpus tetragonolobus TaxID=3891 RepID=A0AAN9RUB1_PSOTE
MQGPPWKCGWKNEERSVGFESNSLHVDGQKSHRLHAFGSTKVEEDMRSGIRCGKVDSRLVLLRASHQSPPHP